MTPGITDEALQLASIHGHGPVLLHASPLGPWATSKTSWVSLTGCIQKVKTRPEVDAAKTAMAVAESRERRDET